MKLVHRMTLRFGRYANGESTMSIIMGCEAGDIDEVDVTGEHPLLLVHRYRLHQDEVRNTTVAPTVR